MQNLQNHSKQNIHVKFDHVVDEHVEQHADGGDDKAGRTQLGATTVLAVVTIGFGGKAKPQVKLYPFLCNMLTPRIRDSLLA